MLRHEQRDRTQIGPDIQLNPIPTHIRRNEDVRDPASQAVLPIGAPA
jgi:hypothetical protein